MGFDKLFDIAVSVFVMVAYSCRQLVKAHILAKITGIIAVYHNGGRVFLSDFFKAAFILRVEIVAQFQIKIVGVP